MIPLHLDKRCPMSFSNSNPAWSMGIPCLGPSCSWWNEKRQKCGVNVLFDEIVSISEDITHTAYKKPDKTRFCTKNY